MANGFVKEPKQQIVQSGDSASIDAFGRWRVSNPHTIFDSKQLHDDLPLFWDDSEVSGGSTTSSHSVNEAATTIGVAATTAGKRVRQTFQRFNYQPGKSQELLFTFSEFDTSTGITKEVGYFDDQNGLFLRSDEGTVSVVRRTYVTGSAVDNGVAQSSWNIDPMDGTGKSGITLDWTKTQILFIDFEWLGVGRVRFGFVVDGIIYYCHEMLNANNLAAVYMSTPNLPIRYSIENDGNGAADEFVHICSTVLSEGGVEERGLSRVVSSEASILTATTAGTVYALLGVRLKSTHLDAMTKLKKLSVIALTNDDFEWSLYLNPTVAGTFTYSNLTNSCMQTAKGASANTVTGGTLVDAGYGTSNVQSTSIVDTPRQLGSTISGTPDEWVLCVRSETSAGEFVGSLTWLEIT